MARRAVSNFYAAKRMARRITHRRSTRALIAASPDLNGRRDGIEVRLESELPWRLALMAQTVVLTVTAL